MYETIKFPNGMSITGTHEDVVDAARKLGFGSMFETEYYNSSTHGLIRIREMNTTHLRNAILKTYRDWVTGLSAINNPQHLVTKITVGIRDKAWINMITEYSEREEE